MRDLILTGFKPKPGRFFPMPSTAISTHTISFSNLRRATDFPFRTAFPVTATDSHGGEAIYIVDDDARVREALSELLTSRGRRVITFRRKDEAACLILDMRLPDISGLDLQQRLANECCPPIIFVSGRADIPSTVRAMKAGAIEFLTKPISPLALEAAIDVAFAQDRKLRRQRLELAMLQSRFNTLTRREREVLPLIAEGLLNKQAAAVLGISEVTLQVHRCQVMRKMAARSFAELVRMAERLGIQAAPDREAPRLARIEAPHKKITAVPYSAR
jgi:FixJ family two-component response regulator